MGAYTIGQVAERSGFSTSPLRLCETHGLLEAVSRTNGGYRLYGEMSLARLRLIAWGNALGCTLEVIAELAELWGAHDCGPVQVRRHELVTDKIVDAKRVNPAIVTVVFREAV